MTLKDGATVSNEDMLRRLKALRLKFIGPTSDWMDDAIIFYQERIKEEAEQSDDQ